MNQQNRSLKLGLYRQLGADIKAAIIDGYHIADDEGKVHLLTTSQTKIPENFRRFWQLKHGSELPSNPQEILTDSDVAAFFEKPTNQRRLRPYEMKRAATS
jgi:hypothetical protein